MEETKRQKQVGRLVQEELSDIFQREGVAAVGGGLISVSEVKMTPDLLEARVMLSFFQVGDVKAVLESIRERSAEWRNLLGRRTRNQLRRIPELQYFADESLERAFKMEALFEEIRKEREARDGE